MNNMISGRTILLTGGGGSISSALANAVFQHSPRLLVLLDHSERNLYEIDFQLTSRWGCNGHKSILGGICDQSLLVEILDSYHPEIVFHLAAFKRVPLAERNPSRHGANCVTDDRLAILQSYSTEPDRRGLSNIDRIGQFHGWTQRRDPQYELPLDRTQIKPLIRKRMSNSQ